METFLKALPYLFAAAQTVITGIFLFMFQRKITKNDQRIEKRAEARKAESILHLKMTNASNELSYAVAMSVRRGSPNGEIEAALKVYQDAKKEYNDFMLAQGQEHLRGENNERLVN